MTSVSYGDVGYINPNGLINMGLASTQTRGEQWWFVMHCTTCHRNCGSFAGILTARRCPYGCSYPVGEHGNELPQADLMRRCGASTCHELGLASET